MTVDYNVLAEKYDLTRMANIKTIQLFAEELPLEGKTILDFGCGTGNFAYALKKLTNAEVYGVEPSDGMREKALRKGNIIIKKGDHKCIPYEDDLFDFIYMTDVIHHVPDLQAMFTEFGRVLKPNGLICIVTESYRQLENRFWVKYFPTTVEVEKNRYPDIPDILNAANSTGIFEHKTVITDMENEFEISKEFIKLVESKGYSVFDLIDDKDFKTGFTRLKQDYEDKVRIISNHGETMLWLKRGQKL